MPEKTIEFESFKDVHLITDVTEVGTVAVRRNSLGGFNALRRTDRERSWRSVDIETVATSGGGPYQDTVNTYHVTFSVSAQRTRRCARPSKLTAHALKVASEPTRDEERAG